MENLFKKLLNNDNYKIIIKKNEIENGPKKYVLNYKKYIEIYKKLFTDIIDKNILKYNILDFGCGPAF
jgi:hypothetical protein